MKLLPLARPLLVAALLAAAPLAHADTPALAFDSVNGNFLDGNTRMLGWAFSVNTAVAVSALGWFDWAQDGLAREHQVGIWRSDTQALLASATVPAGTAGTANGMFLYQALAAPLQLEPGVNYRVAGLDPGGGDPHVWAPVLGGWSAHVNGFAADPALVLSTGAAIGQGVASFQYPSSLIGDSRQALMGPNLLLSPVPEPGGWALLVAGLAGVGGVVRRRR